MLLHVTENVRITRSCISALLVVIAYLALFILRTVRSVMRVVRGLVGFIHPHLALQFTRKCAYVGGKPRSVGFLFWLLC